MADHRLNLCLLHILYIAEHRSIVLHRLHKQKHLNEVIFLPDFLHSAIDFMIVLQCYYCLPVVRRILCYDVHGFRRTMCF